MKPQAHKDIKKLLKSADEVEVPMDPGFYHRLHDKIMMKIEDRPPESEIIVPLKRLREQRYQLKKY
jgi:hypothetical protein